MEKRFSPCDKEYMKMAMLKHEETFREQVYELHRLYQIQKILMKNTSRKHGQGSDKRNFKITTKSNLTNVHYPDIHNKPGQFLDLELPAEGYFPGGTECQIDDENELELTLGLGPTNNCRRKKALDTSLPSDSATSFSSSSNGSSCIKGASSASYQQTNAIREEFIGRKWGLELPSSSPGFLVARKNSSDIEEQMIQDRHNNPPWFLQALSLNTS